MSLKTFQAGLAAGIVSGMMVVERKIVTTVYNLLSMAGEWHSYEYQAPAEWDEGYTSFQVGEAPLVFSTRYIDNNVGILGSIWHEIIMYAPCALATGDIFELDYTFPKKTWTRSSSPVVYGSFRVYLRGVPTDADAAESHARTDISVPTEYGSEPDVDTVSKYGGGKADGCIDLSSYTLEVRKDDSGRPIGLHFKGKLIRDLDRVSISSAFGPLDKNVSFDGTITSTFASHDDFKIIVNK